LGDRKLTPERAMKHNILGSSALISLSHTIAIIDNFGILYKWLPRLGVEGRPSASQRRSSESSRGQRNGDRINDQ